MTGRFCTSCGKPFASPTIKFCTGCGTAVPQAPPPPSHRFCTSCGDPVEAHETHFCGNCGATLGTGSPPAPSQPPPAPPAPPYAAAPQQAAAHPYQAEPPRAPQPPYAPAPRHAPAPPAKARKGLPWKSLAAVLVIAGGGYLWYNGAIPDIRWPGGGGGGEGGGWERPHIADIFELRGGPIVLTPAGFLTGEQEIHIEESTPPTVPLPEGAEPMGPVYEVTAPAGMDAPPQGYTVRLPLEDPSVAEDDTRQVYVAHFDGQAWELHPAQIEEGYASATLAHFSKIWNIVLPRRNTVTAAELPTVTIKPPTVWGFAVRGDLVYANVDVSPSRTARVAGGYRGIKVDSLRVYVSKATANGMASRRAAAFQPYKLYGEDVYLKTGYATQMLVLDFDEGTSMPIDRQSSYSGGTQWIMKVAPVFSDGAEGPLSDMVTIQLGPAEAAWRLRRGVLARLSGAQAEDFEQLTWNNPLTLMVDTDNMSSNAYYPGGEGAFDQAVAMWYTSRPRNFLSLRPFSTYSDVVVHEWGHFATHIIYGDSDFERLPGGAHAGWREGDSRSLVWSEDMATYLGQWGTGRGVPEGAGSMYGRWTNMARDPTGENDAASAWPNVTDMDATRVETIWATVLSRLTRDVGFSRVYGFLRANHVLDGMAFVSAWADQGENNAELARLQKILLSEGVAWKFRGQVVGQPEEEDGEPIPLEGVAVILQTLHEDQDLHPDVVGDPVPVYTDEDGFFEIWAPPHTVHIAMVKTGWEAETYNTHYVNTRGPTNGEVQELEDPLVMIPVEKPVVEILSPSDGDIITERVVTVHGTVAGTADAKPDGPPITQARMRVGSESYDVAVSDGFFSQDVVLEPGPATITVTAENEGGEGSASVSIEAAIEATILKVTLTWAGAGTDVDLWVTDPEGITTGYNDKTPAEGRQLDIDDTDGYGPETYTMSLPVRGTYSIRVNYFRGEGGESFRLRWVAWEGTEREVRGTESGGLSNADNNGSEASANRRFTVEVR